MTQEVAEQSAVYEDSLLHLCLCQNPCCPSQQCAAGSVSISSIMPVRGHCMRPAPMGKPSKFVHSSTHYAPLQGLVIAPISRPRVHHGSCRRDRPKRHCLSRYAIVHKYSKNLAALCRWPRWMEWHSTTWCAPGCPSKHLQRPHPQHHQHLRSTLLCPRQTMPQRQHRST